MNDFVSSLLENPMINYWLVGAMWDGHEDQSDLFINLGYWFLGWKDCEQPQQAALRDRMKAGDRIAIKRMLGQGSSNIAIRAIGIIRDVDTNDLQHRVHVDWVVRFDKGRERMVESRGVFASIHGPFTAAGQTEAGRWVKDVFHL